MLQSLVAGLTQYVFNRADHFDQCGVVGGGGQGKVELGIGIHTGLAFNDLTLLLIQYAGQTFNILRCGSLGGQGGELGFEEVAEWAWTSMMVMEPPVAVPALKVVVSEG